MKGVQIDCQNPKMPTLLGTWFQDFPRLVKNMLDNKLPDLFGFLHPEVAVLRGSLVLRQAEYF